VILKIGGSPYVSIQYLLAIGDLSRIASAIVDRISSHPLTRITPIPTTDLRPAMLNKDSQLEAEKNDHVNIT
jgi:hypothetical protein